MKIQIKSKERFKLICVLISVLFVQFINAQTLPHKIYNNQNDYSFMWWEKTIKTGNQVFAIKTNNYSLEFDNLDLDILNLSINKDQKSEELVLRESNAESFPTRVPCELNFGLHRRGYQFMVETSSGSVHDCQLIETGKYFQRRFINRLPQPGMAHCGEYNSGLEISSWTDRLSFVLKAIPSSDLNDVGAEVNLTFPVNYSDDISQGDIKALKDPVDGSGFIMLKTKDANSILLEGTKVRALMDPNFDWPSGLEKNIGLIIYPIAKDIDLKVQEIVEQEAKPLQVSAEQIAPKNTPLHVEYDQDKGWHQIRLRNDMVESKGPVSNPNEENPGPNSIEKNKRMERVNFTVTNPSSFDRTLRLNFEKGRLMPDGDGVFDTPGISAVLRDLDGNPIGVPVQLSKNWHGGGRVSGGEYFKGTWYHGYSVLNIPANTSLSLEYTSVNALWGGVPAASHAQLCLVGWGYNQQWDESAIGAWGETITYEPDLHQAHAPVLDFRGLFLRNPAGKKWGWAGNIGGADFFNYTKTDGKRSWHSRIRTQYKRYSPNITEVTYAGTMDDNSMDFEYTTRIIRSDDITRGIYKIKLKVLKETTFKDFVVFQAAAASYHQTRSKTLAWGNNTGLKKEWKATIGGTPGYVSDLTKIEGEVPWFSFADSENTYSWQDKQFLSANRGFVIRNWKARIEGKDDTPPWFAEYNTAGGNFGNPSGLINILPPEGCTTFKKGDYIEAEIDLFILPQRAADYYGPNQNFAKALSEKADNWAMVYREAVGNDTDVEVSSGTLLDEYPIQIKADNNKAQFYITGGLGYVPLTISNVSTYRDPELFRKVNGRWQKVDQQVHGNDFWQTEYDAKSGTWDITFNVNLDTPNDERQTTAFRFGR
jgi:hypothetical protein